MKRLIQRTKRQEKKEFGARVESEENSIVVLGRLRDELNRRLGYGGRLAFGLSPPDPSIACVLYVRPTDPYRQVGLHVVTTEQSDHSNLGLGGWSGRDTLALWSFGQDGLVTIDGDSIPVSAMQRLRPTTRRQQDRQITPPNLPYPKQIFLTLRISGRDTEGLLGVEAFPKDRLGVTSQPQQELILAAAGDLKHQLRGFVSFFPVKA